MLQWTIFVALLVVVCGQSNGRTLQQNDRKESGILYCTSKEGRRV